MFKNIIRFSTIAIALLNPMISLAHGENKPGPNGGYIKMPGGFHTELVWESQKAANFKIYLMDLSFQNATVEQSQVSAIFTQGALTKEAICKPEKNFFSCRLEGVKDFTDGTLTVKAKRLGSGAGPAVYKFPLSFTQSHTK